MNKKFSDFTFKFSNGKILKAHCLKLYEDSQYFKDLFDSQQQTLKKISFDSDCSSPISNYSIMVDYISILYNIDDIVEIDIKTIFLLNEYIDSKCLHKYIESFLLDKRKIDVISTIKLIEYLCFNNNRYIKYVKYIHKLCNRLDIESIIDNYTEFTYKIFKLVLKFNTSLFKSLPEWVLEDLFNTCIEYIYENDVIKFNMISLHYICFQLTQSRNFKPIDYYIFNNFDFNKIKQYYPYFIQLEKINDFISKNKSKNANKRVEKDEEF